MLFSDQIFQTFFDKRLGRVFALNHGRVSETLVLLAFEALRENQKLDLEFQKFSQVLKKLIRVIKKLGHVFQL